MSQSINFKLCLCSGDEPGANQGLRRLANIIPGFRSTPLGDGSVGRVKIINGLEQESVENTVFFPVSKAGKSSFKVVFSTKTSLKSRGFPAQNLSIIYLFLSINFPNFGSVGDRKPGFNFERPLKATTRVVNDGDWPREGSSRFADLLRGGYRYLGYSTRGREIRIRSLFSRAEPEGNMTHRRSRTPRDCLRGKWLSDRQSERKISTGYWNLDVTRILESRPRVA